jgi:hypothetical protein
MNILIHQSSLLSERNCPWSQREGEAHSEIIRANASFQEDRPLSWHLLSESGAHCAKGDSRDIEQT